jgi:hypothetical protein
MFQSAPAAAEHSVVERITPEAPPGSYATPGSGATPSPDGSRLLYISAVPVVPADTDIHADVYLWTNGVNELISGSAGGSGPSFNNWVAHASADFSRIYWSTIERLLPEDTDSEEDIYEWTNGTTTMVTSGALAGVPNKSARVSYVTPSASHVFFYTTENLAPDDTDGETDLYLRSGGVNALAVPGTGSAGVVVTFRHAAQDGSRFWFTTTNGLVPEDTDGAEDVYERSAGTTTLVSEGAGPGGISFAGASTEGSRIFVGTGLPLTPEDTDNRWDIFEYTPSGPVLISTGPDDQPDDPSTSEPVLGPINVSPDGERVWFSTREHLIAGLSPGNYLYERSHGSTKVLSGSNGNWGPFGGLGGETVFHTTTAGLVPEDIDGLIDVYAYAGGVNTLVSVNTPTAHAGYAGASADGQRAFFYTTDKVLPADTNNTPDIYERHGGQTTLVSYLPGIGGQRAAVSDDGDVFFNEPNNFGDPSNPADLYVARVADQAGYPRPKGASPVQVALVPAYQACTSPNRTHGPPLAFGSCAPPQREPGRLTVGTPDANGQPAKSYGYVLLTTVAGNAATPVDEADVGIEVLDQDVREAAGVADYTGELQVSLGLRITGRDGPIPTGGGPAPVTQQDLEFSITVPCVATADETVGATCSTATTADAVLPGAIVEQRRTIWALQRTRVLDGGTDGDADTSGDNQVFQTQGIFIP